MRIYFRAIRMYVRFHLLKLYWRAIDARIALLKRTVDGLDDKPIVAELKSSLAEMDQKTSDQHRNQLYTAVGQALSSWAATEEVLVAIASLLLRSAEIVKVGVIMYSIINFNAWLGIIDELFLQEPLYTSLKPKWNKISNRLRGLKKTRDRLAHHTIYYGDKVATLTGDTSLRPGRFDTRQESQKYQPLDVDQIFKFTDSVTELSQDLTALFVAMTELLNHETSQRRTTGEAS